MSTCEEKPYCCSLQFVSAFMFLSVWNATQSSRPIRSKGTEVLLRHRRSDCKDPGASNWEASLSETKDPYREPLGWATVTVDGMSPSTLPQRSRGWRGSRATIRSVSLWEDAQQMQETAAQICHCSPSQLPRKEAVIFRICKMNFNGMDLARHKVSIPSFLWVSNLNNVLFLSCCFCNKS